jgi:hypothetical protein
MPLPSWLSWGNVAPYLAGVPGWYAGWVTWRKQRQNKTILKFNLDATYVAEDNEGEELSENVSVVITNEGERPLTIDACFCEYAYKTSKSSKHGISSTARWHMGKKLDHGESCRTFLRIYGYPIEFPSIYAVDSTGRKWVPSRKEMKTFEQRAKEFWKSYRDHPYRPSNSN